MVSRNVETELKLCPMNPTDWEKLLSLSTVMDSVHNITKHQLEAWYFDTNEFSLRKRGLTYRIRREDDVWVATVKTQGTTVGGLSTRQEFNFILSKPEPTIEPFLSTNIGKDIEEALGNESLNMMFKVIVSRDVYNITLDNDAKIELAADKGEIVYEDSSLPILEIELELKSGSNSDILAFAAELTSQIPLFVESRSKYLRGLILAGIVKPDNPKLKQNNNLNKYSPIEEVLNQLIVKNIDGLLREQELLLIQVNEYDNCHKMLQYFRNIRCLLTYSKSILDDEEYIKFQLSLDYFYEQFSKLEQLHFAIENFTKIVSSPMAHLVGKPWLDKKLKELYAQELEKLMLYISTGKLTYCLLDIWQWVSNDPWKISTELSALQYAKHRMGQWFEEVFKYGKNPNFFERRVLADVEVQVTQICTILKLLRDIITDEEEKIYVRLKLVKQGITYLTDVNLTMELISTLIGPGTSRLMYRDIGLVTGWQLQAAETREHLLREQWKDLRRTIKKVIR